MSTEPSAIPPGEVVVVGNIHVDRMVRVERFPVPGETGIADEAWTQLGGKAANQAIAAAAHVATSLVACVGNDNDGRNAVEFLASADVRISIRRSPRLPTGTSIALIDAKSENLAVISPGANRELSPSDVVTRLDEALPSLMLCQWESDVDTLAEALTAARQRGITTVVNAAPWREGHRDLLSLADHVVVNAVEAYAWIGAPLEGLAPHAPFEHPSVIVTLGGQGASHYVNEHFVLHQPAASVKARSTHGAGDRFVGTLAAAIASGLPVARAMSDASDAAGEWVRSLHKNVLSGAEHATAHGDTEERHADVGSMSTGEARATRDEATPML
jgi:ribokinase